MRYYTLADWCWYKVNAGFGIHKNPTRTHPQSQLQVIINSNVAFSIKILPKL